jgi:hypothetical protein
LANTPEIDEDGIPDFTEMEQAGQMQSSLNVHGTIANIYGLYRQKNNN